MPDFSRSRFPKKSFDKKPFNRNKGGFDRGSRDGFRESFKATCAKCHDTCEVPFRPNGAKPVFCSNCFEKEDNSGRDFSPRKSFGKPEGKSIVRDDQAFKDLKAELRLVNEKLERLISVVSGSQKPLKEKTLKKTKKN